MKKKLIACLTAAVMVVGVSVFGASSVSNATIASSDWINANVSGNKITVEPSAADGAYSYQFKGDKIEGTKTYEMIVDLSKDYTHGELFTISLGLGSDQDTYSTEFIVMTQKNGDMFNLTSGVDPDNTITLEPGIYTYQWTVSNTDGAKKVEFGVLGHAGKMTMTSGLEDSNCVRYLWAFGRDVGGTYTLDRPLVMYKEMPTIADVNVVDGTDGYTPVEIPAVGQKLTANVTMADGTVIGSYPQDSHLKYEWSYEGSDTVLGTDPVYTVTEDNLGKKLTVKVTGEVNGYEGTATWTAADVVGAEPAGPTDPENPANPDNPQDKPNTDNDQSGNNADKNNGNEPVKTADPMTLGLLLAAMGASGAGIAGLRKKNK